MDKKKQIKNSLIYLAPKAISGFIPIAALMVFTRILTKVDFGAFALAEVYAIFVTGIMNFGLPVVYERNFFKYQDKEKTAQLLYTILAFVTGMFIVFFGLTYLFRGALAQLIIRSTVHGDLLFLAFCSTALMSLLQYFFLYYKNSEYPRSFVFYTIVLNVFSVILSLVLVVCFRIGVIGLPLGQLIVSSVMLVVLVYRFLKILPLSFNWRVLKESLVISYPLTPRIFLGVISAQINKYILAVVISVGGVGLFAIGQRIANIVFVYMTALENVFNPQVYKKMFSGEKDVGSDIGKYLTPFIYFSIIIALFVSLFSEEIVRILTPASFCGASRVITVLVMYYGFLFFGKINGIQLIFMKKTFITSALSLVNIGFTVVLCIPFAIRFGTIGVAWATFLVGLICGLITFGVAQYYYRIVWEYKKILSIFSVFFISSTLMVVFMSGSYPYFMRLMLKLITFTIYLYLGIRFRWLRKENIILLRDIVTFKKNGAVVPGS